MRTITPDKVALAVDLFCGLGGWSEALIDAGFDVVGFDIERHAYGEHAYPGQLVIQDATTLHGSQFKHAALICASPPCQEYSWMAMPWKRGRQVARALRGEDDFPENYKGSRTVEDLNRLFTACFRIQREACDAAGRHIPMVVENVRGAQPWVGRARWNYGSFYLWGDVHRPSPMTLAKMKSGAREFKSSGMNWSDQSERGQDFTRIAGAQGVKLASRDGGRRTDKGKGARFTSRDCGIEASGINRKAASAMIAKIPYDLARHVAETYLPQNGN